MNVFAWIGTACLLWAVGVALTFRVMPAALELAFHLAFQLTHRPGGRHAR